ncbi:MAG TPA: DNA cytosine methyltransferase [Gemmatimonadales bacterium]|nr:DNA cytosine methyltransferase [Gemmatimonadales bacterium]
MSSTESCPYCMGIGVLEATDLFCGAGGSSLGLEFVRCPHCSRQLIKVTQALNHWDLAVQAHNENFPDAEHDLHDVEVVPAWRFKRTPLLWASPECVHHAYCRGKKSEDESAERSRMTMNDVFRFTEYHRYDAVIVENVIEARLWEPFDDWFNAICNLGYDGQIVFFNSQFALPTPQSRDRMYCVFWRRGLPKPMLDFQPPSWCSHCERVVSGVQWWKKASKGSARSRPGLFEWGRYGQQYVYACPHCWQNVAPAVIGAKSIINWATPMERIGDKKRPLAPKTRQRIKTGLERLQTTRPVQVQVGGNLFERQGYARVWSVDDPLRTVTGTPYMSVVVPDEAMVLRTGGQSPSPTRADQPMNTITAHDRQLSLLVPPQQNMLIRVNRAGDRRPLTVDEPVPTVAGHGEMALVSFRNHGDAEHIELPAHTVTAGGYHHGLLVYNGVPGFVRDLGDALGTITARDKQSLLVPYYGNGRGKSTEFPMGAVTGKDREALVVSENDIDDCLFRMLQWPELLAAQQMHRHPDGTPYRLEARRKNKRGKFVELSNELRVKMIGNAVSSPVATMLGHAVVESLMAA